MSAIGDFFSRAFPTAIVATMHASAFVLGVTWFARTRGITVFKHVVIPAPPPEKADAPDGWSDAFIGAAVAFFLVGVLLAIRANLPTPLSDEQRGIVHGLSLATFGILAATCVIQWRQLRSCGPGRVLRLQAELAKVSEEFQKHKQAAARDILTAAQKPGRSLVPHLQEFALLSFAGLPLLKSERLGVAIYRLDWTVASPPASGGGATAPVAPHSPCTCSFTIHPVRGLAFFEGRTLPAKVDANRSFARWMVEQAQRSGSLGVSSVSFWNLNDQQTISHPDLNHIVDVIGEYKASGIASVWGVLCYRAADDPADPDYDSTKEHLPVGVVVYASNRLLDSALRDLATRFGGAVADLTVEVLEKIQHDRSTKNRK